MFCNRRSRPFPDASPHALDRFQVLSLNRWLCSASVGVECEVGLGKNLRLPEYVEDRESSLSPTKGRSLLMAGGKYTRRIDSMSCQSQPSAFKVVIRRESCGRWVDCFFSH